MTRLPANPSSAPPAPLRVWGERRPDPDWDRFVAALVALALRQVDETDDGETRA